MTGEILFDGVNVLELNNRERNKLRGHDMAMIYQDALSSLNPAMLIRAQFKQLTKRGGTRTAEELLELVGLDPVRTLASYPHELSGGQRQRVLIAMSLTRSPRLIVADEPPPPSTSPSRPRSWTCSTIFGKSWGLQWSSSATTWLWLPPWPTRSR